jgi:excisionase family DNA binding protein
MATNVVGRELNSAKRGRPPKRPREIQAPDDHKRPIACSVKESAKLLNLSIPSLYKVLNQGTLRSFCVGSRRLIGYEELLRFCRDQTA